MRCRVLGVLLLLAGGAHAQVYKCVQGAATVFTDQPCRDGSEVKMKMPADNPQSDIQFDALTVHYPVSGATYAAVYQTLVHQNAGGFAGWAKWDVAYTFDTKPRPEGCRIERVHIRIRGEIKMPQWVTVDQATPADQLTWNWVYAQLKRHEDGHVQHGREFGVLLRERLLGMETVPCDEVRAAAGRIYRTLYTNLQDRDTEYDRRTQHGLREE